MTAILQYSIIKHFIDHVQEIDPYEGYTSEKLDRVIRAVIIAYDHNVSRTRSSVDKAHLRALEKAYKAYKKTDNVSALYDMVNAYNVLVAYAPYYVSYQSAIDLVFEMDRGE